MRILAIGLGGAGGRIVDMLFRADRNSSKVACVEALAIDIDGGSLAQLTSLPDASKIYFSPLDMGHPHDAPDTAPTATIDIGEVTSRVHTMATGETDAIIICIGLGSSFGDVASHLITALRSSITEPIFGLATLPCLSEGERCSAKAADDIEILSPLLDGVIVFDNETWHKKINAHQKTLAHEKVGFAARLGFKKKKEQMISPTQKMYFSLNDAIIRRISLILRAGEFKADGGIELAEVVLDAGEVLNTIRGMGFITIGYAVEQLPPDPLSFFKKWRPTTYFADEHQKKASRIVELAKQAIYHEISAPCDITSAHKALVLIAGPSHELSMKGYMTVRKWIDRSIAGLETRSGDYPVISTRFVAIIIMLSGLENIPRIDELKEIRAQYRAHEAEGRPQYDQPAVTAAMPEEQVIRTVTTATVQTAALRDEMITLKSKTSRDKKPEPAGLGDVKPHYTTSQQQPPGFHELESLTREDTASITNAEPEQPHHVLVARPHKSVQRKDVKAEKIPELELLIKKSLSTHHTILKKDTASGGKGELSSTRDQERQRIERELQKQRLMALHGAGDRIERHKKVQAGSATGRKIISPLPDRAVEGTSGEQAKIHKTTLDIFKKQEPRTIVFHKKGDRTARDTSIERPPSEGPRERTQSQVPDHETGSGAQQPEDDVTLETWLKQATHRKKDDLNEREGIWLKDAPKTVRDDALLHTDLKREGTSRTDGESIAGIKALEQPREIERSLKKYERKRSDEDENREG
jgi:cell division GTPase FtsZ